MIILKRSVVLLFLASIFLILAFAAPTPPPEKACRAFLEERGWETAGTFSEAWVILPPAEDAAWAQYLAMQRKNGFNMDAFCGERVLRLSCSIQNHPRGGNVQANLYWYNNRIIGGDIMTPALDGFMHGLRNVKS